MKKAVDAIIKGAKAFAEKGRQVDPSSLTAFGIALSSRYGKADEIVEMLTFAQEAAAACVAHYVKAVFYDSKACCCVFELDERVRVGTDVEVALLAVAQRTISQFDWFGTVYHENGESGA